jgi:hypothetical protein
MKREESINLMRKHLREELRKGHNVGIRMGRGLLECSLPNCLIANLEPREIISRFSKAMLKVEDDFEAEGKKVYISKMYGADSIEFIYFVEVNAILQEIESLKSEGKIPENVKIISKTADIKVD